MVNFFTDAITRSCLSALRQLRRQDFIHEFFLAGGTALALQIGYRISTDLDRFRTSIKLDQHFRDQIKTALMSAGQFETVLERDGSLYT